MDYTKIIDYAMSAEMLRRQINECYRIIGARPRLSEESIQEIQVTIGLLQKDLDWVDQKLLNLVK